VHLKVCQVTNDETRGRYLHKTRQIRVLHGISKTQEDFGQPRVHGSTVLRRSLPNFKYRPWGDYWGRWYVTSDYDIKGSIRPYVGRCESRLGLSRPLRRIVAGGFIASERRLTLDGAADVAIVEAVILL
jgi:hypothetical protein